MRKRPQTRHHGCCGCILVGVLAILCLVLMTLLTTCLFRNNHDYEGSWDSSYSSGSYYDSASFWQQDDRVFYESEDGAVGKTGVDVSAYQADIDWWAVAADGIDYAMIRIAWRGNTDGYLHEDICFEQNWAGTQEVGIPCGVYFFSQAVTVEEAREEAVFALDLLAGRELTCPVVFDYEANDGHRLAGIDRETATACARTFCDIISEGGSTATGMTCSIWTSRSSLTSPFGLRSTRKPPHLRSPLPCGSTPTVAPSLESGRPPTSTSALVQHRARKANLSSTSFA